MPKSNRNKRRSTKGRSRRGNSNKGGAGGQNVNYSDPTAMRQVPAEWISTIPDPRPIKLKSNLRTCTMVRSVSKGTLQANTGDTVFAYNFVLTDVPNYSDYTNLFDQYRLLQVIMTFTPYINSVANGSTVSPGIIGTWVDYNDSNLPSNLQQGQQYESYQRNGSYEPFTRVVNPQSSVALYGGATVNSYGTRYAQWIDSASSGVQHYGLKLCIHNATFTASTNVYEVEANYIFQFRAAY